MENDDGSPRQPELRFGAPSAQETESARNLKLIVTLFVGPTAVLLMLGYYNAAGGVLMCTIGAALYFVSASFRQQTPWEDNDADEVIELSLKQQRAAAKPVRSVSVVRTNIKRR